MAKRRALLALSLLLATTMVQAETWNVDKAHSSIGFSVRHLVVSKTTGGFGEFEGSVEFDGQDLAAGSVFLTVQMASVDTDDEKRDEHLRGVDFFNTEKHPTMSLKSKKVIPGKDGSFQLIGDLTIKGITKEVTFDAEFNGIANDPWGSTRAGFSAETTINRQDFGVSWSKALDGGGLIVGNEVKIQIELEVIKAK